MKRVHFCFDLRDDEVLSVFRVVDSEYNKLVDAFNLCRGLTDDECVVYSEVIDHD